MSRNHTTEDETEILSALDRLNFGTTEARVLIGLHKLGTATARDVTRVTDVSRPQIYSAVEDLEQRGLVDIKQANPKQFHPVTADETETLLNHTFQRDIDLVTDYLADVAEQRDGPTEEREVIWTVRGKEGVSDRIIQLIEGATSRIVFGVEDERLFTADIVQALRERASADIDVLLVSSTAAIREQFTEDENVPIIEPRDRPSDSEPDYTGRMLIVDRGTLLNSVFGDGKLPGFARETAYWTSESVFASTVIAMIERYLDDQRT